MWDLPLHCVPVGKASTRSLGPGSMTAPVLRSLHFEGLAGEGPEPAARLQGPHEGQGAAILKKLPHVGWILWLGSGMSIRHKL